MSVHYLNWNDIAPTECLRGAVTIGNFDGVHRGHQYLMGQLRSQAAACNGPAVVLTFDPHPLQLLRPENAPPLLTVPEERARLLHLAGADHVVFLRTSADLLNLSAQQFFDDVLLKNFQPRTIVPGFNFGFGKNREGTVNLLKEYCLKANICFLLVEPLHQGQMTVSSSRIREVLTQGQVDKATEMLGRPYLISGLVSTGQRRGNTIGFPTANLEQIATLIPGEGVYAVRTQVNHCLYAAAANIGPNPTFGESSRKVEVHILDFSGDLYGQMLYVEFVKRLRDTRPFPSVTALKEQLATDIATVRRIFAVDHHSKG